MCTQLQYSLTLSRLNSVTNYESIQFKYLFAVSYTCILLILDVNVLLYD